MVEKEDTMETMRLLAGAARAGARGEVALAALEAMEAAEAVEDAGRCHCNPAMLRSALTVLLESAQIKIAYMMSHPALMEQARQDIASANGQIYDYQWRL